MSEKWYFNVYGLLVGNQALCSNSFLGTWQMLMHEKNECDPFIVAC